MPVHPAVTCPSWKRLLWHAFYFSESHAKCYNMLKLFCRVKPSHSYPAVVLTQDSMKKCKTKCRKAFTVLKCLTFAACVSLVSLLTYFTCWMYWHCPGSLRRCNADAELKNYGLTRGSNRTLLPSVRVSFSHELARKGVQWHLPKQLLVNTNLRKQMNHLNKVKCICKICSLVQGHFFCLSGYTFVGAFLTALSPLCSAGNTWNVDFRVCAPGGGAMTTWGFAARSLRARASNWRDQASVITFFKSNKRKFTAVIWFRSLLGKA